MNGMNFWHESSSGLWRGSGGHIERKREDEKPNNGCILLTKKAQKYKMQVANLFFFFFFTWNKSYKP